MFLTLEPVKRVRGVLSERNRRFTLIIIIVDYFLITLICSFSEPSH